MGDYFEVREDPPVPLTFAFILQSAAIAVPQLVWFVPFFVWTGSIFSALWMSAVCGVMSLLGLAVVSRSAFFAYCEWIIRWLPRGIKQHERSPFKGDGKNDSDWC